MNNKVILNITLSLVLSSFTHTLLAEQTTADSNTKKSDIATIDIAVPKTDTTTDSNTKKSDIATIDIAVPKTDATTEITGVESKTPAMSDYDFSGVNSLRGENALNDTSLVAENKHLPADRLPILRNYFQQPPLIPHRVREYKITVNHNKCMTCHSWKNYKKSKATKVSQTHFADREGNVQSQLAARRYFCNQCHVPQVDAKPLVKNEFKPVDDLK
jgi:cytochrome c-type protein NapB